MNIDYIALDAAPIGEWLLLLNNEKVRKHLMPHPHFDETLLKQWLSEKLKEDSKHGCRVRAVMVNGQLAGWCGIQESAEGYELAVVVAPKFIGLGLKVYAELMTWALNLGHEQVIIYFLHTRRLYRFLQKRALSVTNCELYGQQFTRYILQV